MASWLDALLNIRNLEEEKKKQPPQVAPTPARVAGFNAPQPFNAPRTQPIQVQSQQRPQSFQVPNINDIGKFLFGGTAKLTNSGLGIAEKVGVNLVGEAQKLFGDTASGERTIQEGQRSIDDRLLKQGAGLFGAGGIYNSLDEQSKADTLDVIKRAGGTGLQALSETKPIGKGIRLLSEAKPIVNKVVSGVTQGAIAGGLGNVGAQLAERGSVDPLEAAKGVGLGAAFGGAIPAIGSGIGRLRGTNTPSVPRPGGVQSTPPEPPTQKPTVSARAEGIINNHRSTSKIPTYRDANVQYEPSSGKLKTRGFADTAMNSGITTDQVKRALINDNTSYNVRNTQDLVTRAGNLVNSNLDEAERIANSGNNDVAQAVGLELVKKYQREGNFEAAISRIEDISRKATETGRASQVLAAYGRLEPEGALRFTQRQIDRFNEERGLTNSPKAAKLSPEKAQQITSLSARIQSLPDGLDKDRAVVELTQLMNTAAPTPLLQKLTSIWRAGLLTSARTLEGGALGNTTKAALDIPSQAIASGIDKFITAPLFNNGVRSNVFTLRGAAQGARQGFREGANYLKTGIDPRDANSAYDSYGTNWETGNKVLNTVGKGSDYVYRVLGAVDNPFYYSAKGRANYEEALREASRQGLKGREAREFAKSNVNNLPDTSKDAATQTAREAVFQNDTILGNFASQLKRLPQRMKDPTARDAVQAVVDFTIPFAKIPGAVATALVDYSPAGPVLTAIKAIVGKKRGSEVDLRGLNASIGKGVTGSLGAVWLGSELYKKGLLTLEEPADEKEKQLWQAEGKQKFSVKIGDRWYNMNYIQPLAGLMALGGGYVRAEQKGEQNPVVAAAGAGLKSVTEQSFLQGINDIINLVQNPEQNGQSFINSKAGSFIPNIVKDTARATDEFERETNSPLDALTNGIPGLRQNNIAQRDLYGEKIKTKQPPAGVFLDPFKSTQAKGNDAVTQELRRLYEKDPKNLGVVPTKIDKNLSVAGEDVVLTPQQLDRLEEISGQLAYKEINSALANPQYSRLSDEDKSKKLSSIIEESRDTAKKQLATDSSFVNKKNERVAVNPNDIKVSDVKFKPTGADDTKLSQSTPEYKLLEEAGNLSKEEKKTWLSKPADSNIIASANKIKPQGLPDFPANNEVAELYSNYQKDLADNPDWTPIQKGKAERAFVSKAYDAALTDNQKAIASLNSSQLQAAIDAGQVANEDVKAIGALDEIRNQLGMSTYLSKKDRAGLGLKALPAKGGKSGRGGGKGRKRVGFKAPAKGKFNRIGSTVAIRKLLADAGRGL